MVSSFYSCNFWISYWKAQRQGSGSGGLFVIEFTPTHKRPKKLKRGLGNTYFLVEDLAYPPSFDILLCRSYIVTLHSFKVQYITFGCSIVLSLCQFGSPWCSSIQGLSDGLQKCARAHSISIRFLFLNKILWIFMLGLQCTQEPPIFPTVPWFVDWVGWIRCPMICFCKHCKLQIVFHSMW